MKFLSAILLLLTPILSFSQKMPEVEALNRVILNHKDSIIYAHLLPSDESKKITASDNYWYNWYAQHDIKETKGGFDGKLLHGNYTEYYSNKDLKRKGVFKKGLKTGKWKSWYQNGQLSSILYYKNGLKNGKFILYSTSGESIGKGRYKKGALIVKRVKKQKVKAVADSSIVESKKIKKGKNKSLDSKKDKVKEKKNKKDNVDTDTVTPLEIPSEVQKEKKKKKEPKIRIRRSIKLVPQSGSST